MHHLDSCNILLSYKQSQLSEAIIEHHIKCRKEAARRKQWKQEDLEKAVDDVLEHGKLVQTAAALHERCLQPLFITMSVFNTATYIQVSLHFFLLLNNFSLTCLYSAVVQLPRAERLSPRTLFFRKNTDCSILAAIVQ